MQKLLYAEHYLLTHDVLPIAAKELTVGSFVFMVKPQQRSDDPMERQMAQALKRLKARCGKPRVAGSSKPSDRQLSDAEETHFQNELAAASGSLMSISRVCPQQRIKKQKDEQA